MAMNYFNEYDCDQFLFYQLPKELYTLERYKNLSNDACVLYAMLRDRLNLSISKGWIDEKRRVYFVYTREEAALMIRKTSKTIKKCFDELLAVDLLKEEKIGRTYRLYLGKIQNDGEYIPEIKILKEKRSKKHENSSKKIEGKIPPIEENQEKIGGKFTPIMDEKGENFPTSNTEYNNNTEYIKKERKKKSNFDVILDAYTDNKELKETILDFIKHRKSIKKNLTDKALTLTLKKLDSFTTDVAIKIEILNNSIMQGWTTVYNLKADRLAEIQKEKEQKSKKENKKLKLIEVDSIEEISCYSNMEGFGFIYDGKIYDTNATVIGSRE